MMRWGYSCHTPLQIQRKLETCFDTKTSPLSEPIAAAFGRTSFLFSSTSVMETLRVKNERLFIKKKSACMFLVTEDNDL